MIIGLSYSGLNPICVLRDNAASKIFKEIVLNDPVSLKKRWTVITFEDDVKYPEGKFAMGFL